MSEPVSTGEAAEARVALGGAPVVVVVPIGGVHDDFVRSLAALERFTDPEVPILLVDDRDDDRRSVDFVGRVSGGSSRTFVILENPGRLGYAGSCNRAFDATGEADVVIVRPDVLVGPGWLDGLAAAAARSNVVATVSALTNEGHFLSAPRRNAPLHALPGGIGPETASQLVADHALGIDPTIPAAVNRCVYIRRLTLRLLGGFDEFHQVGDCAVTEFGLRATIHGLRNVCADGVYVYCIGRGPASARDAQMRIDEEATLYAHYRWYQRWLETEMADLHSPLADAVLVAAVAMRGLRLGVDARALGPYLTGTQRLTLETIRSLSNVAGVAQVVVYAPGELPTYAKRYLADCDNLEIVTPSGEGRGDRQCDVIYRPYQLNHPDELDWLRRHGHRVIVNQLDVISFHDPAYATSFANWDAYRELTKLTLATVDGIAFISEQAREEVVAAGLVGDDVPMSVVSCGADSHVEPVVPAKLNAFPDDGRPLLLCVGHSYHHKNRVWAIQLLERLVDRGWDGRLVLAGPNPPDGNSLAAEAAHLFGRPQIADRVTALGSITDPEKQWLMERTSLVLYPTLVEGFGLIPFEAAASGIPVLSTRQGSLAEVLPRDIPTITELDLDAATDEAWRIIHDPDAAAAVVDSIRRRAKDFTWGEVAERIVALANETLRRRTRSTVALDAQHLIGWYSNLPMEPVDDTSHALRYWLEQLVRTRPGGDRIVRAIVPMGSKRQTALRQFVNYLRRRFV